MNYRKKYLRLLKIYQRLSIILFIYVTFAAIYFIKNMSKGFGIYMVVVLYILIFREEIKKYILNKKEVRNLEDRSL